MNNQIAVESAVRALIESTRFCQTVKDFPAVKNSIVNAVFFPDTFLFRSYGFTFLLNQKYAQ